MLEARVTDVIYQGDTYLVQAVLADGSRIGARGIAERERAGRRCRPSARSRRAACVRAEDTVLVADTQDSDGELRRAPGRTPATPAPNGRGLRRDALRERLALLGLRAPALLLVLVTMALPVRGCSGSRSWPTTAAFSSSTTAG